MTASEVIAGAAALPPDETTSVALLTLPGLVDLAVARSGHGVQVVVQNRGGAPLSIAVDGSSELAMAPGHGAHIPLQATPDGDRLVLQFLSASDVRVATAVVTGESSSEGAIAVGQAIATDAR